MDSSIHPAPGLSPNLSPTDPPKVGSGYFGGVGYFYGTFALMVFVMFIAFFQNWHYEGCNYEAS